MMMPSQAHHAVPIGTRLGSNIPVCGGALAVRSSQRGVLGGSNTQVEANAQIGGSRQAACNVEGDLTGHGGPGLDERKVYAQRLTGMAVVGQKRVQIWRFHYGMTGAAGNEDKFLYLPHDAINLWGRVDPTQDQLKKVCIIAMLAVIIIHYNDPAGISTTTIIIIIIMCTRIVYQYCYVSENCQSCWPVGMDGGACGVGVCILGRLNAMRLVS